MDKEQILDTWQINNRIDLYLLDAIADEYLMDVLTSKGRDVGKQFAHIHNVRLMWLKTAAPDLNEKQVKIDTDAHISKALLADRITESGDAVAEMLSRCV